MLMQIFCVSWVDNINHYVGGSGDGVAYINRI